MESLTLDTDFSSDSEAQALSWDSLENHFFLNPRLPVADKKRLTTLLESVLDQFRSHVFLLSSGTTGGSNQDLKWVALSKSALLTSAAEVNRHLKSNSSDTWLHVLPDFHVGGLGIRARSHLSGAQVVRLNSWNVEVFVKAAETHPSTLASLVPAHIYDLVQKQMRCPASMRAVLVGGGALSPTLAEKARELGWPILLTYGMTEACSQVATSNLDLLTREAPEKRTPSNPAENKKEEKRLSELELLPHWAARPREDGRIQIQGDSLLTAYVCKGPHEEALVVDPKEDGWFTPQDQVLLQGRKLQVLGRTQDFIKIGGESVDLARLRAVLESIQIELNLTSDLALVAVADERLGHVIHLVSDHSLTNETASQLMETFNRKVVAFEKIRKWTRLNSLPRTSLGKLIQNHETFRAIGAHPSI